MCYAVYISTDSPTDLAERNSDLVRFEKVTDPDSDPCISLLEYPNKWYIGSKSGCSCTFRHLHISAVGLGFSEPVYWYEEEQDDLTATRELCGVLHDILSSGYHLDLVDRWEGSRPEDITFLDVSLDDVPATAFRMFEDSKFRLTKETGQELG